MMQFGLYFGFITSEHISDGICDAARIFGLETKKKIKAGSMEDPEITF